MNVATGTQVYRRYWWMLVIRGVIAVLFGLAAILWPGRTALVLVYLFGAFALLNGIAAVVVSLQERAVAPRWWVLLIEGIVGILIGILTFLSPVVTGSGSALPDRSMGYHHRHYGDSSRVLDA